MNFGTLIYLFIGVCLAYAMVSFDEKYDWTEGEVTTHELMFASFFMIFLWLPLIGCLLIGFLISLLKE